MSTTQPAATAIDYNSPPTVTPKSTRLASLDIFRGLTIAAMLLVNNPGRGGVYDPLEHASWNGWTPTDLIFPFFIFIMGVAIPFSFAKRGATESKRDLFLHTLSRGLAIFLLGDMLYALPYLPPPAPATFPALTNLRLFAFAFLIVGYVVLLFPWKSKRVSLLVPPITALAFIAVWAAFHFINQHALSAGLVPADYSFGGGILNPDRLRIPGVLQRIGVCYAVAASLVLFTRNWRVLAAAVVAVFALYLVLMLATPYPSVAHPGETVKGLLTREDNFARYVDTTLFGKHVYGNYPDPEGLVSTLPAIGTAILGLLAGLWLRTARPLADRCAGLLAFGVLAVLLAYAMDATIIPFNKQLWTPSYTVLCAGLALLGLGTFFYLSDILMVRKPFLPLTWYGMNAITAFALAAILARPLSMISWANPDDPKHPTISLGTSIRNHAAEVGQMVTFIGDPAKNGSLAYSLLFVAFVGVIMALLYRSKIFLKL